MEMPHVLGLAGLLLRTFRRQAGNLSGGDVAARFDARRASPRPPGQAFCGFCEAGFRQFVARENSELVAPGAMTGQNRANGDRRRFVLF